MEMHNAFKGMNKNLKGLFQKVDVDDSNKIDLIEFRGMFAKMGLKLTEAESEYIFKSIDFDMSGEVTFPEFMADFDHYTTNDVETLIREEREKAAEVSKQEGRNAVKREEFKNTQQQDAYNKSTLAPK